MRFIGGQVERYSFEPRIQQGLAGDRMQKRNQGVGIPPRFEAIVSVRGNCKFHLVLSEEVGISCPNARKPWPLEFTSLDGNPLHRLVRTDDNLKTLPLILCCRDMYR